MKTLLVFPPQAHPTQPALCLPSLTAWMRQNGFEDTEQLDLNLEGHEYFVNADRLSIARDRIRTALDELPSTRPLELVEMDKFRVLTEAAASADAVVDGIEDAVALLRDPDRFYEYDDYLKAVKLFDRALRLISAEHYPSSLTAHNYSLKYSIESEAEILGSLTDERANFFLEYLREVAVPQIVAAKPDLLGISLTYTSQVIPGLSLALLVKQALPDIHITVGGGLLAYIAEKMTASGNVFDAIDSVIFLEGEGPLLKLAQCIRDGESIDAVPNCIHRRDGEVITNPPESPLAIDDLPTPVFDGFPMDRYYSPQLALPLAITRGCYWEKCAFCTLYKVIGPGYRQRSLNKIMDDIELVTEKWGSNVVYFIVEDMPPVLFRTLPGALKEREIDIRWWTDARLERDLFSPELCQEIYDSGCRRIAFGFEAASQRLLDLMEKGTSLEEADRIVRRLSDVGISVTLYTMIGFPTETEEEARLTLQWLRDHRDVVHEVSLRIFYMDHLSKVYEHPENYDVGEILRDPQKDLQVYYDWVPQSGMSRTGARELFFEFMKTIREEFPLFHGDNLLLFELKSHYFLYLCRYGDLSFLEGKSAVDVGEVVPGELETCVPRLPVGNQVMELDYDLRDITNTLNEAECSVLRPRYMSGNYKEALMRELEGTVPHAEPHPNWVAYRAQSSDLLHLGRDAARIVTMANGERSIAEILESFPAGQREGVKRFLGGLFAKGLWTAAQPAATPRPGNGIASGHIAATANGAAELEVSAAVENDVRTAETVHLYCKPSP